MESKKIGIIGGGAAGFFAALSVKEHHPDHEVILFEKTSKVLSKVKVSGGGRCNLTHNCSDIAKLCEAYPRGGKKLKSLFYQFNTTDTIAWFESRGVAIKTEKDGRMFPVSDQSQSIIDCLVTEMTRLKVALQLGHSITKMEQEGQHWKLQFADAESQNFDAVIIATGGSPKLKGFDWLSDLGHSIIPPIPSLFTFNMPNEPIKELMGLVVENARVKIKGTKIQIQGPLLITHWGMSGPAILKASSFGARELSERNYNFEIQINSTKTKLPFANSRRSHGRTKKNRILLNQYLWIYYE